jgi:putative ABC transport system permease protein
MTKDIRFALCMLRSHRWGSLAVIITIALGIGINTTVFTLVNAVLFKPVPIPAGERLVTVAHQNLTSPDQDPRASWPDYLEFKAQNNRLEALEAG